VRIIAATNKNLVQQVEGGFFREDLYYRINVLPIRLPSLKERRECIRPLADVLLGKFSQSIRREIIGFSERAAGLIEEYDWPGNIRQLANTIERAVILEDDVRIHTHNLFLPDEKTQKSPAVVACEPSVSKVDREARAVSLAGQERALVLRALEECQWVQKNAAEKLGISPRSLNYKINRLGITHSLWRKNRL
jgi:DNA-binding NtrC family response regulator